MKYFKNKDILEYLYQNYTKADGLWFVKVEEFYGFDKAFEVDREVWKVIPKLQARFIKKKLLEVIKKSGNTSVQTTKTLLFEALKIKLSLDKFEFKVSKSKTAINARIIRCPWHEILLRSQRQALSAKIGSAICTSEYRIFAVEFDPDAVVDLNSKFCSGEGCCDFKFSIKTND